MIRFRFKGFSDRANRNLSPPRRTPLRATPPIGPPAAVRQAKLFADGRLRFGKDGSISEPFTSDEDSHFRHGPGRTRRARRHFWLQVPADPRREGRAGPAEAS